MTDAARIYSPQVDQSRRRAGEIFTPAELVEHMLDGLPPEAFCEPERTFLDPACGDGNFLAAVQDRLMQGIAYCFPDATERHRHIIEHQLYGVEIMSDNAAACVDRLDAHGLKHNIVCADALSYDFEFKK